MPIIPAVGRVSSARGMRGGVFHAGWDIAGKPGDVVVAPERGVVVARWLNDTTKPYSGYGPAGVVLAGESGFFHLLGHLDPSALSELSELIEEGQTVGVMSSANHVHWEVRTQPALTYGTTNEAITIEPADWLRDHAPGMPVVDPPASSSGSRTSSSSNVWLWLLLLAAAGRHLR